MSVVGTTVFGPMVPKLDPELLKDTDAQSTTNLKHTSGALQPWLAPAAVGGVTMPGTTQIETIYRFGKATASKTNYWFQFTTDVNVVKGPVASDTEERTYWTDGTYCKKTKSSIAGLVAGTAVTPTSLRMGVPPPGWAGEGVAYTYTPAVSVSGSATDANSTPLTSTYVVTYVSSWGEESAPSNPSAVIEWRAGQTVAVTLPGAIAGAYDITHVRLYRSNTGTNQTTFQLVTEVAVATSSYNDTTLAANLGEVCPTFDWLPPLDAMVGLCDMGNGMLAGFENNTVHFCEPNIPYAWPAKYDTTVSAPIVGIAHFGQTLVVGTTDGVVLMTGIDPGSITEENPTDSQSCASKRSMISALGGVVYSSPDGLAFVGPSGPQLITKDLYDRDQWQALVPTSMRCYHIDNRIYVAYDTGSVQGVLIFSFETASSPWALLASTAGVTLCDQYFTAGYNDERADSLFIVTRSGTTNTLKEWNTGSALTASWRSKEYRFHSGVCMSRAAVKAASYPVTFTIYHDGAAQTPQTVSDGLPFALPSGRASTISYKIDTTAKVTSVKVASSVKELGDTGG